MSDSSQARTRPVRQRRRRTPWWRQSWARLKQEIWAATTTSADAPAPLSWATALRWHLLPLSLYLLSAIVASYPLITHFTTHIPSNGSDALQGLWGYWLLGHALSQGQNPYETSLIYAPYGAPLYLFVLTPLNGLASLPFQWLFGTTVAFNVITLLSFALNGYFAYLLVSYLSRSRFAGFLGGTAYAFSAYHLTHLLGHCNLLSSHWLPAYLLCLFRALHTQGRQRTKWLALAVGSLLLITLTDWFYVILAILFTLLIACWFALRQRTLTPFMLSAVIGVVWLICSLPLLVPTILEIRSGITDMPPFGVVRNYSADPLSFFLPSTRHWLLGSLTAQVRRYGSAPPVEGDIFLGFVPLLLAGYALWRVRHKALLWALLALIFAVLALGPVLHMNGRWSFGENNLSLPLPYYLLMQIPGLSVIRTPVRLAVATSLCLAILAGFGVVALQQRWPVLGRVRGRGILGVVVVSLILAEQLTLPFPLERTAVPAVFQQLANAPGSGGIVELPISYKRARSNLYQTVHARPAVAGYISRRLDYPYRALLPVGGYGPAGIDIFARQTPAAMAPLALAWGNINWIVVYLDDPNYDASGVNRFLELAAAGGPVFEDAAIRIYHTRPPAGGQAQALSLGDGWHDFERLSDGKTDVRWMGASAIIHAWHLGSPTANFALRFDAISFNQPRRLEVLLDGHTLGEWRVTATQRFDIPLTLTEGQHRIELRALEPPTAPMSVLPKNNDPRLISFAIANVYLEP